MRAAAQDAPLEPHSDAAGGRRVTPTRTPRAAASPRPGPRGLQRHLDLEAAPGARGERKGAVVRTGDALHDHEPQPDARVVVPADPCPSALEPQAVTDGCPALYADPTEDPRTRR